MLKLFVDETKKVLFLTLISFLIATPSLAGYLYGGPKLFYYDVTQEDLDSTAQDLVNLGFSTATVEANTAGVGFDIGLGFPINEAFDIEGGFVYMGEFELKATMTGPAETVNATSSAWSLPLVGKLKVGDANANIYVKAGAHYWKQNSEISASKGTVKMWGTGLDPVIGIGVQLSDFMLSYEHYSFSGVGAGAGIGDGGMSAISATWKTEF